MSVSDIDAEKPEALKVMRIFRGRDAPTLEEAGHMEYVDENPVILEGLQKLGDAGIGDGAVLKCLFSGFGFSLHYAWFKPGYPLPLHSHNGDCLYYIIGGDIRMGKEEMGAGDGFFLPANTPYSYKVGDDGVELLEFRTQEEFDIQFKGKTDAYWEKILEKIKTQKPVWNDAVVPERIA